jgi:hypothetical protein
MRHNTAFRNPVLNSANITLHVHRVTFVDLDIKK